MLHIHLHYMRRSTVYVNILPFKAEKKILWVMSIFSAKGKNVWSFTFVYF